VTENGGLNTGRPIINKAERRQGGGAIYVEGKTWEWDSRTLRSGGLGKEQQPNKIKASQVTKASLH